VDSWVGDQVGLELSDIDVQGSVESQRGSQGGNDLTDKSVQVGVSGSFNVQVSSADIVDGLVVQHDGNIGVLQKRVGTQDGVVGLDDGGGDLGRGVDGEAKLGFLSVVNGKSFQKKGTKTRSGTSSDGLEDQESLKTGTVVGQFSDSVKAQVDNFSSNGVVASGEVVGGVLFSGDQLFGVEQLSVGSGSDLVNDGGFKIKEDTSGDVFAGTGLREEGVEGIISSTNGFVGGHLTVGLDSVLKAEKFPTGVTNLATSLSDVD